MLMLLLEKSGLGESARAEKEHLISLAPGCYMCVVGAAVDPIREKQISRSHSGARSSEMRESEIVRK